jgi:hypothetical protein
MVVLDTLSPRAARVRAPRHLRRPFRRDRADGRPLPRGGPQAGEPRTPPRAGRRATRSSWRSRAPAMLCAPGWPRSRVGRVQLASGAAVRVRIGVHTASRGSWAATMSESTRRAAAPAARRDPLQPERDVAVVRRAQTRAAPLDHPLASASPTAGLLLLRRAIGLVTSFPRRLPNDRRRRWVSDCQARVWFESLRAPVRSGSGVPLGSAPRRSAPAGTGGRAGSPAAARR